MASYSWDTTSGSFAAASNWSPAVVPGAADTALFGSSSGTVSGTGSVALLDFTSGGSWSLSGQAQSGGVNDQDTLTILNGSALTAASGVIGVGNALGATGSLVVDAGGTVSSTVPAQTALDELTVANSSGSTGSVTVTGLLDMGANGAGIGNAGAGSLSASGGGTVRLATSNSAALAALSAGSLAGSQATLSVSGSGSTIVATGSVYVGRAGTATLTVSGGGAFTGGNAASGSTAASAIVIGDGSTALNVDGTPVTSPNFGGSGSATVTGSGSLLHSLYQIIVGYRGTAGSLVVSNSGTAQADANIVIGGGVDRTGGSGTVTVQSGGTVRAGTASAVNAAGIELGSDVSTVGAVMVSGSGSTLDANGNELTVGGSGAGTLTISGGGRALAGASVYLDYGAALLVARAVGSTGSVTISGAGSILLASGDAVIGGSQTNVPHVLNAFVPVPGGTGAVTVSGGGTLGVSGTLTIEASGTLTVDASSTLNAPAITINGGTANLGVLSSGNAVTFGTGGVLVVATVSGANTVGNFTFGDTIDVAGSASVSGSVVSTSSGTITLGAAPANTSYQMFDDGHGGELVALTPQTIGVYRFFDTSFGTHFYTASASEAATVLATRPDLTPEGPGGIGLQAVSVSASDPNAVQVYRFFDTVHGTHFFTASASERDGLIASRPDLTYEPSSSFYEHGIAQPGDTPVYRFFDNVYGTHFYTDSESERAGILANRPDLVAEGVGFYEPHQNYAT